MFKSEPPLWQVAHSPQHYAANFMAGRLKALLLPFIDPDNLLLSTTCCQNLGTPKVLHLLKVQRQYTQPTAAIVEVSGIEPESKLLINKAFITRLG